MIRPSFFRAARRRLCSSRAVLALALVLAFGGAARAQRVLAYRLDVDLAPPHGFAARCELDLAELEPRAELLLELNRGLRVTAARLADGSSVRVRRGPLIGSAARSEGRPWRFDLAGLAPDGRATLVVEYAGRGEDRERDWRGVLLVRADEVRMSEQTVFYPELPLAPDGPRAQRAPFTVRVTAPADLEVFVPGLPRGVELVDPVEPVEAGDPVEPTAPTETSSSEPAQPAAAGEHGARKARKRWSFELPRPSVLSIVAGRWVRHEADAGGTPIVTLLRPEHAELGPAIAAELERCLAFYDARFGAVPREVLGVVEIRSVGPSSYNWASQGLIAMERGALGNGVPRETLAHEAAHLWWGQAVAPSGLGERFLTESLAEWSAWRFLASADPDAARAAATEARARWLAAVDTAGSDAALARTGFDTPAYSALAYDKGPLVLRALERRVGAETLEAALARFTARFEEASPTLADFEACVRAETGLDAAQWAATVPWLAADGHLELALADVAVADGVLTARLTARRWPGHPDFPLRGAVELGGRCTDGATFRTTVDLVGGSTPVRVAVPGPVAVVELDPDATLPAAVSAPVQLDVARLLGGEPAPGASDVAPGTTTLVLRFDRSIALAGLREAVQAARRATELEEGRVPHVVDAALAEDGAALVLVVGPLEPERRYVLPLEGLVDAHGLPVQRAVYAFTTGASADREAPVLRSSSPADGATDVPCDLGELRLVFSEPMRIGTGFPSSVVRELEAQGLVFPPLGERRWEKRFTECVYALQEPLEPGTTYVLPLRSLFRDVAGNPTPPRDWTFTTR